MYSGNYRAPGLDYKSPGTFMITMLKRPEIKPLAKVIANDGRFKTSGDAISIYEDLGQVIRFSLEDFFKKNKEIEVWQQIVMPDHIHFLLHIKETLPEHLGKYLARLKIMIRDKAIKRNIIKGMSETIFEEGYNDQFLWNHRNLSALITYIQENPSRYYKKKKTPHFFEQNFNLNIAGEHCRAYGNLDLLKNPFIDDVVYHRSYSPEEFEKFKKRWLYTIYNRGVISGAFIHDKEKEILKEAVSAGGKIILIDYFPEEERWKPYKSRFDYCATGNLLILCPKWLEKYKHLKSTSRERCLLMNAFSQRLASIGLG